MKTPSTEVRGSNHSGLSHWHEYGFLISIFCAFISLCVIGITIYLVDFGLVFLSCFFFAVFAATAFLFKPIIIDPELDAHDTRVYLDQKKQEKSDLIQTILCCVMAIAFILLMAVYLAYKDIS